MSEANEAAIEAAPEEVLNEAEASPEGDQPEEATSPQAEEKAAQEAVKELKKKFNIKANGKSREVELDLNDDASIQKYLEQAFGAQEKFEEAASVRKQAEQLVQMLKENPKALLKHKDLGLDVRALATEILNEELAEMEKSPEQRKLDEMERKLKEYEEEKKRLEEEKRNAEMTRIQQQAMQQIDEDITAALAATDLPKSPYVVKRIADTMIEAVNLGYENVRIQDIMPYVEAQIASEIQQMFEAKPSQVMEKLIGKKNLDNYRKERVAKVKKPIETAASVKDTGANTKVETKEEETARKKFKDVFSPF